VTTMLSAIKPAAVVYNGLKLINFFISRTELEIILRELHNLTIFVGLKERAEMRFINRPDGSIGSQLKIAHNTVKLLMKVMDSFAKIDFIEQMEFAELFS